MKKAEECDAVILRLFETTGQYAEGRVMYSGEAITPELRWKAYEIKTLRLELVEGHWHVRETNLLERECV